jgi:hypothetical protein
MSVILVKEANGTFTLDDNGIITTNLKAVYDKRKSCHDIRLPDGNSIGRKWVSESRFKDGEDEVDLEAQATRTTSSAPKTPKLSWLDFVDDEDKEVFEAIKAKAEAKMKKAELMNQIEAQKKLLEKLMAQVEEEKVEA